MATSLVIAPDGTLCVDKDGDPDTLATEAALLESLDVAGVPRVVESPSGGSLRLRHAGRHTLETWVPPSARDLAAVVASVADTVEALHDSGVLHGSIRPDHVVVAGNGAPVLVGFSSASRVVIPDALSPAVPTGRRTDDIAALGSLCDLPVGPATRRRSVFGAFRSGRDDDLAALRDVARRVAAGRFSSARGVGDALRTALDLDRAPTAARPPHDGAPPRSGRGAATEDLRRRLATTDHPSAPDDLSHNDGGGGNDWPIGSTVAVRVAATLGVVAIGLVAALVISRLPGNGPDGNPAAADSTVGDGATPATVLPADDDEHADASTSAAPTPAQAPPEPQAQAQAQPVPPAQPDPSCSTMAGTDVDGDGCDEVIVVDAGAVLVDGIRYAVGDVDDTLAVGDWDCDGTATVMLVRPDGEIWSFPVWPSEAPVEAVLVGRVPPPADTTTAREPDSGCARLVVRGDGEIWSSPS